MSNTPISIALCLFIAACGSEQDEPTRYEQMNFEQRQAFMTEVVLPEMQATFRAFDPTYQDLSCATCHGDGASDGTYAMPSPRLPRLPATEEGFLAYNEDPEHARWSTFMIEEVWPQMSDLLELPAFDPVAQPDGFSCSNCHMADDSTLP